MASSSSRAVLAITLLAVLAYPAGAWAKVPVETVRPLVARLGSTDASERAAAEKALLKMGPDAIAPLLEILAQGNLVEVDPIRELLPKYGPGAIDALAEAGSRDFGGMDRRVMWNAAADAVVRMGDPALPVILEGFKNPGGLFTFSTQVLARMQEQDRRATPLLIPLLDHPTKEVRERAAAILANYPDPRAFEALIAALKSEDSVVRMYAAQGLGNLRDPRAVDTLLRSLGGSWGERRAAAAGLGKIYHPRFRVPLARMARNDSDSMARDTAANVLLYSNDPLAVRLGRRYKPIALSPARRRGIELWYSLMLGATFVAVLGVALGSMLALRRPESPRRVIAGLAACALGAGGVLWGGVLPSVTAVVEYVLLLLVVPLAAAVVYGVGALMKLKAFRPAFIASFGALYLGYGLGWLWLWGHLGF